MKNHRRKRYHHGNLSGTLVAVGLEIVGQEGVAGLSLREVAKRSKVSPGAVYRHFPGKEALLAAIAAEGFAALNAAFDAALAAVPPTRSVERLRALGSAYISLALEHNGLYRLMFGVGQTAHARESRLAEQSARAYTTLENAVAACCAPDADAGAVTAATVAAWSLVHGYAMLRLDGQLASLRSDGIPDATGVLSSLIPADVPSGAQHRRQRRASPGTRQRRAEATLDDT